ncbi:PREDICTED: reverse mRNAase [Prunus dulcis]|uniref:PREDICTED: reverse mRNAase n=1 Tax=Prunus dulcis TaxID=3755 RepID=A0A5E4G4N1_PRUDU|nr:PREDICTED: reverse mRNAase [Prunus dulcis]
MDTKVSTLISASRSWDVPKVYSLFTFMEAETILSIPLVCDNVDCRIWHFTTHGRYTVNSGYWVALEYHNFALSHTGIGTSSNPSLKLWKHLWTMKVPAKIQHFFWRFAQNGILTKVVLFHRKIAMGETCFRCSTGCETSVYALQDCPAIRPIWESSELPTVFLGAVVMRAPSLLFVFATELYALKVGLSFALDASLLPLVVESDSLLAVQLLSKEEECLAPEGVLVTKIRLPLLALSSCVRFVPHTANTVAYRIARYSL